MPPPQDQESQEGDWQIKEEEGVGVKEHRWTEGAGPLLLTSVRKAQNQKSEREGAGAIGDPGG